MCEQGRKQILQYVIFLHMAVRYFACLIYVCSTTANATTVQIAFESQRFYDNYYVCYIFFLIRKMSNII